MRGPGFTFCPRHQARGRGSHWATYLSFQQNPGKVLVTVNALWKIHLHRRERPADTIWRATAHERRTGMGPHRILIPSLSPTSHPAKRQKA